MSSEEIEKLETLLNQPIKSIRKEGQITILEMNDGTILPLIGGMFELSEFKVLQCNFCGVANYDDYLYTPDDKNYICKGCTIKALETFGSNGIPIDLNLSKISPDLAKQLASTKTDS